MPGLRHKKTNHKGLVSLRILVGMRGLPASSMLALRAVAKAT
jgi:hypothetical protein